MPPLVLTIGNSISYVKLGAVKTLEVENVLLKVTCLLGALGINYAIQISKVRYLHYKHYYG